MILYTLQGLQTKVCLLDPQHCHPVKGNWRLFGLSCLQVGELKCVEVDTCSGMSLSDTVSSNPPLPQIRGFNLFWLCSVRLLRWKGTFGACWVNSWALLCMITVPCRLAIRISQCSCAMLLSYNSRLTFFFRDVHEPSSNPCSLLPSMRHPIQIRHVIEDFMACDMQVQLRRF